VLSDFNINLDTELAKMDIPVVVSDKSTMRKGYNRVLVLDPLRSVPFEIIVHNKEAYGREVDGIEDFVAQASAASSIGNAIVDYSTGWKHSLAIAADSSE
jgi:hypothetical protein